LFGASIYNGGDFSYVGGDTYWWLNNFANLMDQGVYTDELNSEHGYFTRLPGYYFFIGFFYMLTGKKLFIRENKLLNVTYS